MFRYGASLYGNVFWTDVTMPTLFISLSWASCLKTELKVLEMTTSLMMLKTSPMMLMTNLKA